MFENITYDKTTGKFFNKNGKEVGWKNSKGYVFITVENRKAIRAHRLAWYKTYGVFPTNEIDHINGNRSDNRIENLREVTRLENMHNLAFHREGNYPCIKKRYNKFAVYIRGKYLGLYNTPEEAKTVVDNYSK
jgi:hypothetical protein